MSLWAWLSLIASGLVMLTYGLGILSAAHAVMTVRSSQGAIAWGLSLVTFPWLALPLYWVLGRYKFTGYSQAFRSAYAAQRELTLSAYQALQGFAVEPKRFEGANALARSLTEIAFTRGNQVTLLRNGEETFGAMLAAIAQAQDYVFLQTYILRADGIGHRFQRAMLAAASRGVRIYLLYDAIGSHGLSQRYIHELEQGGVTVAAFRSSRSWRSRWQINFRNHRKILLADGRTGFVGGLNIGDEYLGKDLKFGSWRDTHLRLRGPSVQCLQIAFLKDWYWATRSVPDASWHIQTPEVPSQDAAWDQTALVFPTGPVEPIDDCTYFFTHLIHQAQNRLWIASPYFVPDEPTLAALKTVALRGVDVRIILPDKADHWLVYLSSFSYYDEMKTAGIRLYRYEPGFLHQKVLLLDNALAAVGTVNLDNRSFRLNFEVMTFVPDRKFLREVEAMLIDDLSHCREVVLENYGDRSFAFRLMVQITRLLAPLL